MSIFSERVKCLIKARNLTQARLARVLNLSPSRLSNYIAGDVEAGNALLCRIADALETTTDYLIGLSSDACPGGYPKEIKIKYAGTNSENGAMVISIPVFKSGEISCVPYDYLTCGGIMKNKYVRPYCIDITDDSMQPYCIKGDRVVIAPRTYLPPVINNLDPKRLYAVRTDENDKIGLTVRHCLAKDDVIFLRPSNMNYDTLALNFSSLAYKPVAGVVVNIIRQF